METSKNNIITKTDSYKGSHYSQYPKGTTKVYSYLESRGGVYDNTVFFGLQYILKEHLVGKRVTRADVDQAEIFWNAHFGGNVPFNREMWDHIADNLDGKLPIRIKAVPEGTVVPVKNVLMTIENTDDKCFALTNFLETILLQIWAPITVATNSRSIKKEIVTRILNTTDLSFADALAASSFLLHDFGFRGVSSYESSALLGAGHLVNFMGTDTVSAIILLMNYYQCKDMPGFSVPASEHSTATPYGRGQGEKEYLMNMLTSYPKGIVSVVSDSFDVFGFVKMATEDKDIRNLIMNRDGKVVFRPDSGDPVEVNRKLLSILEKGFGVTVNSKGYKELPSYVGIIQGDGIDREMVNKLLDMLEEEGFAATTLVYGSGGGLLQKFNRDTQKFAIKCSHLIANGVERDVQKDPITAPGKKSKTGYLSLVKVDGNYTTLQEGKTLPNVNDELVTVFENGELLIEYSLETIRANAQIKENEIKLQEKVELV